VDYVYTKNPKEFKDATPIRSMSWKYFCQLVGNTWRPGLNAPFDPIASKLAQKMGLKVIIANGQNMPNLAKIIEGKEFIGTVIG
jgi:uridylate kinase